MSERYSLRAVAVAIVSVLAFSSLPGVLNDDAAAYTTDVLDLKVTFVYLYNSAWTSTTTANIGEPINVQGYVYLNSPYAVSSVVVRLTIDGVMVSDKTITLQPYTQTLVNWWPVQRSATGADVFTVAVNPDHTISEHLLLLRQDAYANNQISKSITIYKPEWTVMAYMDGDNNLEQNAIDKFLQLSSIGSSTSMSIVAQLDRIPGYSSLYGGDYFTDCNRYFINRNTMPDMVSDFSNLGEVNMASGTTFSSFLQYASSTFIANRYLVIIFDHGDDWVGTCLDSTSSSTDRLTLPEMATGFQTMYNTISKKVDLAVFDCCLQGSIETITQVDDWISYAVAVEGVSYVSILPYFVSDTSVDGLIEYLSKNVLATTASIAQQMVARSDTSAGSGDRVVAAYDMSKVASFLTDVSSFATALKADFTSTTNTNFKHAIIDAREGLGGMVAPKTFDGPYDLEHNNIVDLASFLMGISQTYAAHSLSGSSTTDDKALQIYQAFATYVGSGYLILARKSSASSTPPSGISIYHPIYSTALPTDIYNGLYDPAYVNSGSFVSSTVWDDYLLAYIHTP